MIGFCPLASGSKGNALYLGTEKAKLLIDVGISTKQLSLRLAEIGVTLEEIDAVIITHEHHDHIAAVKLLNQKFMIPLFTNRETAKGIYRNLNFIPKCKIFTTGEPFTFRDVRVIPFSVQHDTPDPVGLRIEALGQQLGICTDLGFVTTTVKQALKGCHLLYVEANHEPELVLSSKRPQIYKTRVLGRQGHLSNQESAGLISSLFHQDLKRVYLAHLSSECNRKELAKEAVLRHMKDKMEEPHIAHQEIISLPYYF